MTALRSTTTARTCLLLVLGPFLLAGCNLYTVPDTAPRCASGASAPTPAPTPSALPGSVRFGAYINPNFTVHQPRTMFGIHQTLAWIAHFSHPIAAGRLYFGIWRDECGRWVRVYTGGTIPYGPGQPIHTRGIVPALRLEYHIIQLGTYQVRYLDNRRVVARGTFTLR